VLCSCCVVRSSYFLLTVRVTQVWIKNAPHLFSVRTERKERRREAVRDLRNFVRHDISSPIPNAQSRCSAQIFGRFYPNVSHPDRKPASLLTLENHF